MRLKIAQLKLSLFFLFSTPALCTNSANEELFSFLAPVYITNTNINASILKTKQSNAKAIPTFLPLSEHAVEYLAKSAKLGNQQHITEIFTRIFWGALKNPFTLEEIIKFPKITTIVNSHEGYIYWPTIIELDGIGRFSGLYDRIMHYAEKYNSARAQYALGLINKKGRNLWGPNNYVAVDWLKKSADKNFAPALTILGTFYQAGIYVEKDRVHSLSLFRKAADQGYLPANFLAGQCYFDGKGAAKDLAQALEYLLSSRQPESALYLKEIITVIDVPCNHSLWDRNLVLDKLRAHAQLISGESGALQNYLASNLHSKEKYYLDKFIRVYEKWTTSFLQTLDSLGMARPGFLITNVSSKFALISKVFTAQSINEQDYVSVGYENVLITQQFIDHLKNLSKLERVFKKLDAFNKKQQQKHSNKALALRRELEIKSALLNSSQNFLSDSERSFLPMNIANNTIDLRTHELLAQRCSPISASLLIWVERAKQLEKMLLEDFIEEGLNTRHKEFLSAYPYLRKQNAL